MNYTLQVEMSTNDDALGLLTALAMLLHEDGEPHFVVSMLSIERTPGS